MLSETDPYHPGTAHPRGLHLDEAMLAEAGSRVNQATGQDRAGEALTRLLTNTATTTVRRNESDTFVITGDIPAMWLRDSCAQLAPLLRLAALDESLLEVPAGLLRRHWRMIRIDPYANAFNEEANGARWDDDDPLPLPWVWERKWEIDSLSFPLDMADRLHQAGSTSWIDENTYPAFERIVAVMEAETDHEARSPYTFTRTNCPPTDTLVRGGKGQLTHPCGLVWSGFRPSDDACELGFNIPGNAFAARALAALANLIPAVLSARGGEDEAGLADRARRLAEQIVAGIREEAIIAGTGDHPVLAYEIDGGGRAVFMDDSNMPSLLSLPYLGVIAPDDPLYLATRAEVLSAANPYLVSGSVLQGVGSPHTPPGYVWHIALAVQALTSTDRAEQQRLLTTLLETTGGTGYMHEGVHSDDPNSYTRPWFSWSNAMYCELALEIAGFARPEGSVAPLL